VRKAIAATVAKGTKSHFRRYRRDSDIVPGMEWVPNKTMRPHTVESTIPRLTCLFRQRIHQRLERRQAAQLVGEHLDLVDGVGVVLDAGS